MHGVLVCCWLASQGLATLTKLRVLDVSNNRVSKIEGLETLSCLEDLWLNDNQIKEIGEQMQEALKPVAGTLTTIYLENNPAVSGAGIQRGCVNNFVCMMVDAALLWVWVWDAMVQNHVTSADGVSKVDHGQLPLGLHLKPCLVVPMELPNHHPPIASTELGCVA